MILYFIQTLFKRSYKYLLLTFFSIFVGSFLFGAVIGLTQSISGYFISEGKTLIGGDIVLSSPRGINESADIIQEIINKSEGVNKEYSVQAVFKSETDVNTSVATIRAVEASFPLYGNLELEDGKEFSLLDGENSIYVEKLFLEKLNAEVGDYVLLGSGKYKISGIIKKEPDQVSVGVSFSPKVIMALSDFKKSGIDLSKSRATYKISLRENKSNLFTKDELIKIENYAKENKLRYDNSVDGPNNLIRGLSSVQSFSSIVLGIALFLVMVNIIANLSYVVTKFSKTIAILKTFGATSLQIQIIYTTILGSIGFVSGFIGALCGAVASNYSLRFFSNYLEVYIETVSTIPIALLSSCMGLLIIVASAIPFLISLNDISAKELLSRTIAKKDIKLTKMFLSYLPIPLLLFIFLYIISSSVTVSLYSVLGLVGIFLFFLLLSSFVINLLYRYRSRFSFVVSSGVSSLKWRGLETVIVSASIMTAFSGIFIISAIEDNIIRNLNQNISADAPSLYIVDINKSQLERVREISGESFTEYPTIRGRLLKLNDRDMTLSDDPGITREFSMTYRSILLQGENIESGVWHGDTKEKSSVSIDTSFADDIGGVNVGDTIQVFIQGIIVNATVTSLHSADRSAGTPFFFLVFSPDILSDFPASYFGTVYTDEENVKTIEDALGKEFPNIIPIRTGKIIETVSGLLENVVLVVKIIGVPSLILGLILIMIMTSQSLYERRRDVLILRAFGLIKSKIIRLFVTEVTFIILLASVTSFAIAHVIAFVLNLYLFDFDVFVFSRTPLYISVSVLCIVTIFSYFISLSTVKRSLKEMLAEK